MHTSHEEQRLRLRVRQMRWEADGILSLELDSIEGSPLPRWSPGAHLDLMLPGAPTRQYSLCGSPGDGNVWRIAVLREPASRGGSLAVHETLRPGELVDVVGPRNNFPLVPAPRYIFIAGGIGITPLLPMMEEAERAQADWRLEYGGRTRASMAFVDQLVKAYGDKVAIVPQDERGLLDLVELLGCPVPGTEIYCCGPEPLLAAVEAQVSSSWPKGSLHVERFAAKPQEASGPTEEVEFDVVLQRSGAVVTVPAGMSVLEALEASGIDAPNSCREGICGTCEVGVVEGIPEHRDSLLSEEERAANETMMICVGRALCPKLVLDL